MQLYLVIALALAVAVALFAIQNNSPVQVRLLAWKFESSLVVVILASTALGALLTALLGIPRAVRTRLRLKKQSARVIELEATVAELEEALRGLQGRAAKEAGASSPPGEVSP